MAIVQTGFLGRTGPVFVDDSTVSGKKIILVGDLNLGKLQAKQPAFAENLRGSTAGANFVFDYAASDCSLGPYADNQIVSNIPAYQEPPGGIAFDYYIDLGSGWVSRAAPSGGTATTTTTTGGTTTTTTGGTTTTGATTTDTTFAAPTITEQITTFLSNYWWLVGLIVLALLWKPVIAPALGMGKRKRR